MPLLIAHFTRKAKRIFVRFRLKPIRVFCLHHISDQYNPAFCSEGDWISTVSFKEGILQMMKQYRFISLDRAHQLIQRDLIRFRHYAVLTFDDGNSSILPSLKWLEEMNIPYTLFLNTKYWDGLSCSQHVLSRAQVYYPVLSEQDVAKNRYLVPSELNRLSPSLSSFASHGYEHVDATKVSTAVFRKQLLLNLVNLRSYYQFIPYHAFTWGRHSSETDRILQEEGLVPVLMDGNKNYNDPHFIHRELFPF